MASGDPVDHGEIPRLLEQHLQVEPGRRDGASMTLERFVGPDVHESAAEDDVPGHSERHQPADHSSVVVFEVDPQHPLARQQDLSSSQLNEPRLERFGFALDPVHPAPIQQVQIVGAGEDLWRGDINTVGGIGQIHRCPRRRRPVGVGLVGV